jgi:hypothetical protein
MLSDEQGFGFARIHTASERSIKNLNSALLYICSRTGNRLAGVTIPIKVTKEKATPIDKKTGMAMETWVPILSVGGSFDKIIEDSMETLKAYEETRKLFAGKVPRPYEEEADRAAEIPAEFPNKSEPKALPEAPESAKATEPPPPAEKAAPAAATPPPQASQPASEKPKSEKPKVAKLAVKFHGMPKAMTENAIASGPNKGKPFWKLTLEAAGGDVTLLVFSSTVREKIDGAIKRSQEVELDCESQVRAENSFTKVNDVVFLTKTPEPEPAGEEPPADWMLD